jgi:photosystem II stability/assembly factor-like uncharacterized protein
MKKRFILCVGASLLSIVSCDNIDEVNKNEKKDCDVKVVFESSKTGISKDISSIKVFKVANPTDITFADENVGYISGSFEYEINTAVIAKTTDGGNTWEEIPVLVDGGLITQVVNIYAKSRDTVYASYKSHSDYGTCFSSDGGCSWTKIRDNLFRALFFTTPQIGFEIDFFGSILKTEDGAKTWRIVYEVNQVPGRYENDNVGMDKCFMASEKVGYSYAGSAGSGVAGGFFPSGTLYKTTDGGNTWSKLMGWSEREYPTKLAFIDVNNGYAFTFNDHVYQTTDGGVTWTFFKDLTGTGGSYYDVVITKNDEIYMVTANEILRTKDNFQTIETVFTEKKPLGGRVLSIADKCICVLSNDDFIIKMELYNF